LELNVLKILVLEYATASGIKDPSIHLEGKAMLSGLLDDLKGMDVSYLISNLFSLEDSSSASAIELDGDLMGWLNENICSYDSCLVIAPEEEFILFKITELVEKKGLKVIGSASEAVRKCSDKYEMYESLKDKVPIIETEKVFFNDIDDYEYPQSKKKVVKPVDGVSCSGVKVVNNLGEFKAAAYKIQTRMPYFVVQDFIEGTSVSVSLLSNGKEALPLSLNCQKIQIEGHEIDYRGGQVPLNHELEQEAKNIAKKAVESIKGLKGYIGVDMILGDDVYLVEINSRITTSYVALKEILDLNLGEAILNSVNGHLPSKINLKGKVYFYKDKNNLKINKLE